MRMAGRQTGRQVVSHTARRHIQIPASAAPVRLHLCAWCAHAPHRLLIHNNGSFSMEEGQQEC